MWEGEVQTGGGKPSVLDNINRPHLLACVCAHVCVTQRRRADTSASVRLLEAQSETERWKCSHSPTCSAHQPSAARVETLTLLALKTSSSGSKRSFLYHFTIKRS